METQILIYLLKASASLAVFYTLYILFLRNDTLLGIRRMYFLFVIIFSLIFPSINIQLSAEQIAELPQIFLPAVQVTPDNVTIASAENIDSSYGITSILLLISAIISSCLILKFIIQIASIINLKNRLKGERIGRFYYMSLNENATSSFSFFNLIFLNVDNLPAREKEEIIAHEEEHARQLHSFDVLLIETICILFWWNPFVWMIRREMKTNLEYLADRGVIKKGYDSYRYQYTLLQSVNNCAGIPLINNFNVSQLKKRITMMNKEETSIFGALKYLLVLPLVAALLFVNCSNTESKSYDESDKQKITLADIDAEEVESVLIKEGKAIIRLKDGKEVITDTNDPNLTGFIKKGGESGTQVSVMGERSTSTPFHNVEQMPVFPGGDKAMFEFIGKNLKYPAAAQAAGLSGRVIVRFVVTETGEISDVTILRGFDQECDKEALRVVKMMPNWTPGKQNGQNVDVYYVIPIIFKLEK